MTGKENPYTTREDHTQQGTQLPEDVFNDLFVEDTVAVEQTNGRHQDPTTRPPAEEPPHYHASGTPNGSQHPGQPVSASHRRGAFGLKSAVGGLLKRAAGAVQPGKTQTPQTSAVTSARASDPEALVDLEHRMKISLRETALSNIAKVGVGSPKGGVGKSSTAYGIAGAAAYNTNMRVVLVDADPNFGSTRLLVPRPIQPSVVDLARDAHELDGLSDLRGYIAQNDKMRLDVVLGPTHAYELAEFDDLGAAYERIDRVLSRHYDLIVYDLGLGFRDPAIRQVLGLCNELMFVTDSEVIPNAMLADGIAYIQHLGVDLDRTTLVINHRLPAQHESADTAHVREAADRAFRHVTDIPYDDSMSQLLNRRAFHIESLSPETRRGILTTLAACLEGLMTSTQSGARVAGARRT